MVIGLANWMNGLISCLYLGGVNEMSKIAEALGALGAIFYIQIRAMDLASTIGKLNQYLLSNSTVPVSDLRRASISIRPAKPWHFGHIISTKWVVALSSIPWSEYRVEITVKYSRGNIS